MRMVGLAVLVATVAAADPNELVDGEPVRYWATTEGGDVVLVERHEDGWREVGRGFSEPWQTKEITFISDPKGALYSSVRAVRASYRGKEGWQALRWGMTAAEVKQRMKGKSLPPQKEVMEGLAWATTVADRPARVGCIFADGRLVSVSVKLVDIAEADFWALLTTKYGEEGTEEESGKLSWSTSESRVSGEWRLLGGIIRYSSKVFVTQAMAAMERLQEGQSKDL